MRVAGVCRGGWATCFITWLLAPQSKWVMLCMPGGGVESGRPSNSAPVLTRLLILKAAPYPLQGCREGLVERARRGMFAEGATLDECRIEEVLTFTDATGEQSLPFSGDMLPVGLPAHARASLSMTVVKPIAKPSLVSQFGPRTGDAEAAGTREVLVDGVRRDVPLYRVEDQTPGIGADGPAVLEEAFFTCRIDAGWRFQINAARDISLIKHPNSAQAR